jgi:hypothetical protein
MTVHSVDGFAEIRLIRSFSSIYASDEDSNGERENEILTAPKPRDILSFRANTESHFHFSFPRGPKHQFEDVVGNSQKLPSGRLVCECVYAELKECLEFLTCKGDSSLPE